MKSTILETTTTNPVKVLNSRSDQAEERLSAFEDRLIENIQSEEQKEKTIEKWTEPKRPVGHY